MSWILWMTITCLTNCGGSPRIHDVRLDEFRTQAACEAMAQDANRISTHVADDMNKRTGVASYFCARDGQHI